MAEHLTDPREIRKLLSRVAYRGDRIDGKVERNGISSAGSLTHNVMQMAAAQGLSGEDAMTVLAYHALLQYERTLDMLLHEARITVHGLILTPTPTPADAPPPTSPPVA